MWLVITPTERITNDLKQFLSKQRLHKPVPTYKILVWIGAEVLRCGC